MIDDVKRILSAHFHEAIARRSYGVFTGFNVYGDEPDIYVDHYVRVGEGDGFGIREREEWLPKYEEILAMHYTVHRVAWGTRNARLKISSMTEKAPAAA